MLRSFGIENGRRRGKWIPSKDSGDLAKDTLLERSGATLWGELIDRLSICSSITELIIYVLHRNLFDSRRYKIRECLGRGCAGCLEEMSFRGFQVSKFRNYGAWSLRPEEYEVFWRVKLVFWRPLDFETYAPKVCLDSFAAISVDPGALHGVILFVGINQHCDCKALLYRFIHCLNMARQRGDLWLWLSSHLFVEQTYFLLPAWFPYNEEINVNITVPGSASQMGGSDFFSRQAVVSWVHTDGS